MDSNKWKCGDCGEFFNSSEIQIQIPSGDTEYDACITCFQKFQLEYHEYKVNDRVYVKNSFDPVIIGLKEKIIGTIIGVFDKPITGNDFPELEVVSSGDFQVQIDDIHSDNQFTPQTRNEIVPLGIYSTGTMCLLDGTFACEKHSNIELNMKKGDMFPTCPISSKSDEDHYTNWIIVKDL